MNFTKVLLLAVGLFLFCSTITLNLIMFSKTISPIKLISDLGEPQKASMEVSPFIGLIPEVDEVYSPSFDDIYLYINSISKKNPSKNQLSRKQISDIIHSVEKYCVKYGINKLTIFSMIKVESNYILTIPSWKGSEYGRGLLQVSKIALLDFNNWTGNEYTSEDLYTIEKNIEVGIWAFNQNYHYGVENGFEEGAIVAYNVGVGDYKRHKKDLLSNQMFKGLTYEYSSKVQTQYQILISSN